MYNNNTIYSWKPLSSQELSNIYNKINYTAKYANSYPESYPFLESLQTNLVKNPGFETSTTGTKPDNWASGQTSGGTIATFNYGNIGNGGTKGVSIAYTTVDTGKTAYWTQNISGIVGNNTYTLSGYIKTENLTVPTTGGIGVALRVNWYDSANVYISSSTVKTLTATTNWAQYSGVVTAPTNAVAANIICAMSVCTGTAYFDDISFTGTTSTCTTPKYKCVNNNCTSDNCDGTGTYADSTCNNTCTPGSAGCGTDEWNIAGACVKRTYVLAAGAGFGILVILMLLKS